MVLFFTPYQSPARGCKAASCTQNPRHEKTYIQGLATPLGHTQHAQLQRLGSIWILRIASSAIKVFEIE